MSTPKGTSTASTAAGAQSPPPKPPSDKKGSFKHPNKPPCRHLCALIPSDVPAPEYTQAVLHPRKDVFVLKVAKVGPNGDRHCRMELELVTPKMNVKPPVHRVDTRETQCEPECSCCCGRACGIRRKQLC